MGWKLGVTLLFQLICLWLILKEIGNTSSKCRVITGGFPNHFQKQGKIRTRSIHG